MKTGPQQPPRFKMPKLDIILAFGLLVVVIVLASWHAASHKPSSSSNSSATSGWSQYSSSKYGFKFSYPGSWGTPQIVANKGTTGSQYQVVFVANPKSKDTNTNKNLTVSIEMDSADYAKKICPSGQCHTISNVTTSKTIQSDLKTNSKSFVKYDSNSYGFIVVNPPASVSTLTVEQIVNIPKSDVSAATASYSLAASKGCAQGKFTPSTKSNCVTQSDYDTVNNALKSIQAL